MNILHQSPSTCTRLGNDSPRLLPRINQRKGWEYLEIVRITQLAIKPKCG